MLFTWLHGILDVSASVSCIANLHAACKYSVTSQSEANLYTVMIDLICTQVWRGLTRSMGAEVMDVPGFEATGGSSTWSTRSTSS